MVPWSTCTIAAAMARWPGLLGDGAVHLLGDPPVRRVALGPGPQLDDVQRLAGVHLHDVADPVGQGDRVRRLHGEVLDERVVELPGTFDGLDEGGGLARLLTISGRS